MLNRKLTAALVSICTLLPFAATAQQTPTFRSRSELVVVPAIVTDHAGQHILGLHQQDFRIRENGVDQKIVVFQEIKTNEQPVRRVDLGPGKFSNYVTGEVAPRRITIIALDLINTPFADLAQGREQLMKFLANAADTGEPVTVVAITRSGVKVIHDFTTDPKVLALAIRRLHAPVQQVADQPTGEAGPEETEIAPEMDALLELQAQGDANFVSFQEQMAAQLTIQAFAQIAQAYAGIPGRKSLIWASSGFPFSITNNDMGMTVRSSFSDFLPLYERTWQLLNDVPMAVYPVDLRGLVTLQPGAEISRPSADYAHNARFDHFQRLSTFDRVAKATGGRAFVNSNDIAGAFRKAADDSTSYYVVGYYRNSTDRKPGWRKLNVTVSRPGLQVRTRSGFFVSDTAASPDAVRERELRTAMNAPLDYTAIPFTAQVNFPSAASVGKRLVKFQLILAPNSIFVDQTDNNHMKLDVVALAKSPDGLFRRRVGQSIEGHLTATTLQEERQHGTSYNYQMELDPGEYTLRFLVRDELDGRIGTVTAPVKIQ